MTALLDFTKEPLDIGFLPTASTSRAQMLLESQPERVRREKSEPVIITKPQHPLGCSQRVLWFSDLFYR